MQHYILVAIREPACFNQMIQFTAENRRCRVSAEMAGLSFGYKMGLMAAFCLPAQR